jgi:hypothetical protein
MKVATFHFPVNMFFLLPKLSHRHQKIMHKNRKTSIGFIPKKKNNAQK